ncbi:hypothetical protein GCK72_024474 [Caenorhabditis remanei]|uniref:Uncharacterized protein n=2 Tax=Caenorhabditis remanei TaxID=31234 RepID=E3LDU8_CAERE|nr:hypothetical protein GCK72_024474 [Caenorhabditis remanei]EFO82562.1 hypothetical protein CRE_00214 [Caenorhabditis remanei]KAF1748007.1 hypothetical protein GCK72_024474 [Caenorhabditis remanei]
MGAVISQLGFNQPFLLALAVIVILLGLTVVAVGHDNNEIICDYVPIPQIRILPTSAPPPPAPPRKNM